MNSGIGIRSKSEYAEMGGHHRITGILQDILVMAMLLTGVAGQSLQWTQISGMENLHLWWIQAVGVLATVILGHMLERKIFSYLAAPAVALAAVAIHGIGAVYRGFFGIINYMISWWNVSHEDAVSLVMQEQISANDVRVCVMVVMLLMIPVWWNVIRHRRVLVGFLVVLLWIVLGLVVQSVSVVACGAFLAGGFGLLLARGDSASGVRSVIWQVVVSTVCIGSAVLAGTGKMKTVVDIRDRVNEAVQDIRYGHDTLPEGDLSKAAELLQGDDEVLVVTTEQRKNIYLNGFVGARYADGKWDAFADAQYRGKREGMLSWLSDRSFIAQSQYADYDYIDSGATAPVNVMTVKNVGANRKYVYAPYSSDIPSGAKISVNEDSNYLAYNFFGARNYEYTDYSGDRPGELLYADSWVSAPETAEQKQYVEAEAVYSDFVYDSYLDVDEGMAAVIDRVFSGNVLSDAGNGDAESHDLSDSGNSDGVSQDSTNDGNSAVTDTWENADTIYSVTEQIRDVLKKNTTYVEAPEMSEKGVDPVEWFLVGGRQGNSVLYASAAVMAFRCKGIPARYVEGYMIKGENASEEMTLTNRDSHAWVEVYLDGVGWIPVDVTPGFYYDTYTLLQMVKMPQNVNESAFSDESSNMGSQLNEDSEQDTPVNGKDDKKTPLTISLDILVVLILLFALFVAFLEIRSFVRRFTLEKRYNRLTDDEKTAALSKVIIRMLRLYGCDTLLGWNAEAAGEFLTGSSWSSGKDVDSAQVQNDNNGEENTRSDNTRLEDARSEDTSSENVRFYPGEYLRISGIMEKYTYGQQSLTKGEIRTLYVFAEKLYAAGKTMKIKIRLKLRYGM